MSFETFYIVVMLSVFFGFVYVAWCAYSKKSNRLWLNILKYAPSMMTTMGLFGTFLELTSALDILETAEGTEKLQPFVDNLSGIFYSQLK